MTWLQASGLCGYRLPACTLLALCLLLPSVARTQAPPFRFERSVQPGGKGANHLAVDVALLSGAASSRLGDLRFYDRAWREVAYLLVYAPAPGPRWTDGRILPIASTKDTSGLEVDLGRAVLSDRLRLTGIRAPFLKRFQLEGSGDRSRWTLLVGEGTLFDLPDEQLRQTEAGFAAGEYRYFRITWDDRASARVAAPARVAARLAEALAAPPPLRATVEFQRLASEPGRSRFRIRLPGPRLPIAALELTVGAGHLLRPARVLEPRLLGGEVSPVLLGSATLRRAERGDLVAADLRILIGSPLERELDLVVDDGNNPPLALSGVTVEFIPLPWIYFESETAEALTARYGNDAVSAPRYDLEAVRGHLGRARPAEARWGESRRLQPEEAVAVAAPFPAVGAPIETAKFRYSRKLPTAPQGLASLRLDAAVLAHSRAGLEDVRLAGADGLQIPYLLEKRDEPLSLDLSPLAPEKKPAGKDAGKPPAGQSRYQLKLPYATLPAARLVLATAARVFERQVAVEIERSAPDPRSQPRVEIVAESRWRHSDPETLAPHLALELPRLGVAQATLVIDEGDNTPLLISTARLLLPSYRLRFFHPPSGGLTLLYGLPELAAPRYDLALLAPRLMGVSGQELAPAPEEAAPAPPDRAPAQKKVFWGVLIAAVVILLFLLVRLLRSSEDAPA